MSTMEDRYQGRWDVNMLRTIVGVWKEIILLQSIKENYETIIYILLKCYSIILTVVFSFIILNKLYIYTTILVFV